MKILFLGDSITEGVGASCSRNNYVNLVKSNLNCDVINYGVSGTRIGRQTFIYDNSNIMRNYDFRLRAQIMVQDADMVFVLGGTNDHAHGNLALGNVKERTPNTFCNELRLLIEFLIEKYGKEKLCFMLPPHQFNEEGSHCKGIDGNEVGADFYSYVEAMRQIIIEYGIDIIDLYKNSIPQPLVNTGDEYTVDGVHPNDNGHRIIAEKICEYIKRRNKK